ncbi:MAG: hypothetical protein IJ594_06195 [Oscillospiraceae bacterium]|nr:hypothetical protein [Oscillospiraceae bacterium]
MREQKIKEYLRTIYVLQMNGVVRGAYVAREMNVTKPTVSVALRSLVEDGYLIMEPDHSVRLTELGRGLGHEAMRETVDKGRDYHHIVKSLEEDKLDPEAAREALARQRLRWLQKERAEDILEAIWILSKRYYCVRGVDVAHYLKRPVSTIRSKLKRLEHNQYVVCGEDGVAELTDAGLEAARLSYEGHAALRQRLQAEGLSADDAEQEACTAKERP